MNKVCFNLTAVLHMPPLSSFSKVRISCIKFTRALEGLKLRANGWDRGGGGAGRAIAVPLLLLGFIF